MRRVRQICHRIIQRNRPYILAQLAALQVLGVRLQKWLRLCKQQIQVSLRETLILTSHNRTLTILLSTPSIIKHLVPILKNRMKHFLLELLVCVDGVAVLGVGGS